MEFIKPAEISAKICSLISEADKKLIIVSPYNNFSNWPKLLRYLNNAEERGVDIKFFVRKGANHKGFERTKIRPIEIPNLHAKLYMNEKNAIITSMNLLEFSDENSLDIALQIDQGDLFEKVNNFYKRYILQEPISNSEELINIPATSEARLNELKEERFFEGFYFSPYQADIEYYLNGKPYKEFYHSSTYIKEYGITFSKGKRHGKWLEFDDNGLVKYVVDYNHGNVTNREYIDFNKKVSKYWIMASIANIVGGFLKVSTKDLYFQSYIEDYVQDNRLKLYEFLEEKFKVKFRSFNHEKFDELASHIGEVLYFKNNRMRA